jgi:hypothetical protein
MNIDLNNSINNCITALRGFINGTNITVEQAINDICPAFYNVLSNDIKSEFFLDEYKNNIREIFAKKEPPKGSKSHDLEPWLEPVWRNCDKKRFESYLNLLKHENKGNLIPQISADTFEILDSCKNPSDPNDIDKSWDRRGLVYGHVQSGKTANYIGLINRAFDVGYKVVIVFTGVTEDLRKQTQNRIDLGVIGRDKSNISVGVGLYTKDFQGFENIKAATNLDDDLSSNNEWQQRNLSVNEKSIWVIKKNKTVLENLIFWLKSQSQIQGSDYEIRNIPFLIIDDEADNASIQSLTQKEFDKLEGGLKIEDQDSDEISEEDQKILDEAKGVAIKAINRNIRIVLSLISQKSFVAYTATPYSVINQCDFNIQPEEIIIRGEKFRIDKNSDLFPKHFILPLEPGSSYLGIEKVFPIALNKKIPILTDINSVFNEDLLNIFPTKKGSEYIFSNLPNSLIDAIHHFIVVIHIRNYRKQVDYNSMLIHTSHLTNKVDYLSNKVNDYITNLTNIIVQDENIELIKKFNQKLNFIQKNSKNPLYKFYFGEKNTYFIPDKIDKNDIYNILKSVDHPLEIVSYHSSKYKKNNNGENIALLHPNKDLSYPTLKDNTSLKPKNYIVIGGNRLSRGLTLEGLSTSYFIRNSSRQDSLYQMGRWFGYRSGFEDCVQIYMKSDQIEWYTDICKLELDLRSNLEEMNECDIEPRDWVIRIANHKSLSTLQNKITVCDPSKLRNTRNEKISLSGTNKITKVFNVSDRDLLNYNYDLVKVFIDNLINQNLLLTKNLFCYEINNNDNNLYFIDLKIEIVLNFLKAYKYNYSEQDEFNNIIQYIEANDVNFTSFSVCLKQINNGNEIGDKWLYKNRNNETIEIKALTRNDYNEINSSNLVFKSIIEGLSKSNDRIFDIIDTEDKVLKFNNLIEKRSELNKYIYDLRKNSARGLLVITLGKPTRSKDLNCVLPFLHLTLPGIPNSQMVHIIRNKR